MAYIADLVSFLGGGTAFASALHSRLAALDVLPEMTFLNRVPLMSGRREPFSMWPTRSGGLHAAFFASKSVVSDGPAGGQVFVADEHNLFFVGMRQDLLQYVAAQDFAAIHDYAFPATSLEKTVRCRVPVGRFRREFFWQFAFPESIAKSRQAYVEFSLSGHLHYCQSGLVIGVLPVPEDWRRT
jgi:hypothetical protein